MPAEEVDYYKPVTKKEQLAQIAELERRINELQKALPNSTPENWLKRNWYWASVVAAVILGSGIGVSALTVFKNAIIDDRIREALREPLQDIKEQGKKITEIDAKVSSIDELLKMVVQSDLHRTAALPSKEFQKNLTAVQNRHKSSDPCCKRGLYVPGTGVLRLRSAAVS
jgi:Mg2+ and Co2+ transporter CorA